MKKPKKKSDETGDFSEDEGFRLVDYRNLANDSDNETSNKKHPKGRKKEKKTEQDNEDNEDNDDAEDDVDSDALALLNEESGEESHKTKEIKTEDSDIDLEDINDDAEPELEALDRALIEVFREKKARSKNRIQAKKKKNGKKNISSTSIVHQST